MSKDRRQVVLVVDNVRSAYNVGSLLRTADGLGVKKVYLSGYTPYPKQQNDSRPPHVQGRVTNEIAKTALGAQDSVDWEHIEQIESVLGELKKNGYQIAALEQTSSAINLNEFSPKSVVALIVGNEVNGLDSRSLELAQIHVQIPMTGQKESFNVSVAAAITLYYLIRIV
ncbi:MAG TPA: TrmH family RNA methyltransferase [Candidatus Saccharimonadales bacterium]|nr:TrmH family RNA methyltransferase [Candidatus Saccharimonadales bacterium]